MAREKHLLIQNVNRPGEGAQIAITSQRDIGDGMTTISLDLGRAPVPDRRYAADAATVLLKNGVFRFIFAQTRIGGAGLRSLVDVQMSAVSAKRLLEGLVDAKIEFANGNKMLWSADFDEPSQAVGLAANLAPVAIVGEEACIDFYQVSPFVGANLAQTKQMFAEPVVRVTLLSKLFFTVAAELSRLLRDINAEH